MHHLLSYANNTKRIAVVGPHCQARDEVLKGILYKHPSRDSSIYAVTTTSRGYIRLLSYVESDHIIMGNNAETLEQHMDESTIIMFEDADELRELFTNSDIPNQLVSTWDTLLDLPENANMDVIYVITHPFDVSRVEVILPSRAHGRLFFTLATPKKEEQERELDTSIVNEKTPLLCKNGRSECKECACESCDCVCECECKCKECACGECVCGKSKGCGGYSCVIL